MLSDFDATKLYETIPDFHNTRARVEGFFEKVKKDECGRVKEVEAEIKAIKDSDTASQKRESSDCNPPKIIVLFAFEDLDILMRYAKQIKMHPLPLNQLYKFEGIYFLMIDMTDCDEEDVKRLSATTDEYATDIFVGAEKRAFIYEHGKAILKERAIEQLQLI